MANIDYFTLDPCYFELSLQFTGINGNKVLPRLQIPCLEDLEAERIVIDLDHMPSSVRDDLIKKLVSQRVSFPVDVHSNNLNKEQVAKLKAARVRVHEGMLDASPFR